MITELFPTNTFELRDYQKEFIAEIYASIQCGNSRIACIAATGSGKTIVAAKIIHDALSRGKKVLFLVTIDCLIQQTLDKLQGVSVGAIAGKYPRTDYSSADVFVASLQTLARRRQWLDCHWDLAIWDEAHTSCWFGVASELLNSPDIAWHLGFTATPYRLSRSQAFGDIFQDAIIAPSMGELIAHGSLAPLRYFAIKQSLDLSGIRIVNGDYELGALASTLNTHTAINCALDALETHAPNKRTIAFSVNVDHAKEISRIANERGIKSAVIVGDTQDRHKIFAQLANLEIQLISSCMALSTGFDLPQVEVALLMRPTMSTGLFEQQIGRVGRIAPGKTHGIVIDGAGNVRRHGFPCIKIHTKKSVLAPSEPSEDENEGEAPVKECPKCDAIVSRFAKVCPECGHKFGSNDSGDSKIVSYHELMPLKPDEVVDLNGKAFATGFPADMVAKLRGLGAKCRAKNYKRLWLAHAFYDAYPSINKSQMAVIARMLGYSEVWVDLFLKERRSLEKR